MLQVNFSSKHC